MLLNGMEAYSAFFPLSGIGIIPTVTKPNTPLGMFVKDLLNTTVNRATRNVTGNQNLTVIQPKTITNIPDD